MTTVQLSKQARVYSTILTILVFGLLRSPAQGQIPLVDPTFAIGSGTDGRVYGIALQTNGSLVIGGGFNSVSGCASTNIAHLSANGKLDTLFPEGPDGTV